MVNARRPGMMTHTTADVWFWFVLGTGLLAVVLGLLRLPLAHRQVHHERAQRGRVVRFGRRGHARVLVLELAQHRVRVGQDDAAHRERVAARRDVGPREAAVVDVGARRRAGPGPGPGPGPSASPSPSARARASAGAAAGRRCAGVGGRRRQRGRRLADAQRDEAAVLDADVAERGAAAGQALVVEIQRLQVGRHAGLGGNGLAQLGNSRCRRCVHLDAELAAALEEHGDFHRCGMGYISMRSADANSARWVCGCAPGGLFAAFVRGSACSSAATTKFWRVSGKDTSRPGVPLARGPHQRRQPRDRVHYDEHHARPAPPRSRLTRVQSACAFILLPASPPCRRIGGRRNRP